MSYQGRHLLFDHLGEALFLLRRLRRLSQAELARRAHVGRSQLSRYEQGQQLPQLGVLQRLLESLGFTLYDLALVLHFLDELSAPPRTGTERTRATVPITGTGMLPMTIQTALEDLAASHEQLHDALRSTVLAGLPRR